MNNPYEAPASANNARDLANARIHLLISLLIAAFGAYYFVVVWIDVLRYIMDGRPDSGFGSIGYGDLASVTLTPLTLAVAGVCLVFRRKLSVLLFAAYLFQYFLKYVGTDRFNLLAFGLVLAFGGYALWRWKAGQLTGWPGGSMTRSTT